MSTSFPLAAAALIAVCVLATSCRSALLDRGAKGSSADQVEEFDRLVGDRVLAARFVLVGMKTERREGRLRVQFDLKNTTPADLAIEWVLEWKNRNGFSIDACPEWRAAIVSGQDSHSIQASASTTEAASFRLHLRKRPFR